MTNNKQQTAVEWFIEQLEEKGDLRETPSIMNIQLNIDTTEYLDLKIQAKEMEKQKSINDFVAGNKLDFYDGTEKECAEQYYNETYGGNK
jgi:hypothetical protein